MTLPEGEPAAGPWDALTVADMVTSLLAIAGRPIGRPRIVAVEGRSASGKTTIAAALTAAVPGSAVVHTDDLSWNEPMFMWGHLLRDVLESLYNSPGVSLRPPAWERLGREGSIEVAPDATLVIIEGVGANQREVAYLIDATIWVQSDAEVAERRGIARDIESAVNGDADQSIAFWHWWMSHEAHYLNDQRPWERADLVVAGTPPMPLVDGQFAVAPGPLV